MLHRIRSLIDKKKIIKVAQLFKVKVMQVGLGWSGAIGTGLVVGQKDGAWTSPSAISLAGLGWGFQVGGTVSDILVVLRNRQVQFLASTKRSGVFISAD